MSDGQFDGYVLLLVLVLFAAAVWLGGVIADRWSAARFARRRRCESARTRTLKGQL